MLKTAMLIAMASASVEMAVTVKPGDLPSVRNAYRTSRDNVSRKGMLFMDPGHLWEVWTEVGSSRLAWQGVKPCPTCVRRAALYGLPGSPRILRIFASRSDSNCAM